MRYSDLLKLFVKLILIVCVASLLSLGVDFFFRRTYKIAYQPPTNLLPLPEIPEKYDVVKLGNSHTGFGLTFEKYNVKALDVTGSAQTYEYDLAYLKMYHRQIKPNAIIIVNASPISFSQEKPTNEDVVNMQFYDGRLSPFLIPHFKLSEYLQIQFFPFLRAGFLWRQRHAAETKENAMNTFAAGWGKSQRNTATLQLDSPQQGGETADVQNPESITEPKATEAANLVHSELPTFNVAAIKKELTSLPDPISSRMNESVKFMVHKWDNTDDFNEKYFRTNKADLQKLLDYCREQNWRPVLVTMPLHQGLLDALEPGFEHRYIYNNLKQINTYNAPYINFLEHEQLKNNEYLYSNSDHLNERGAAIASYLLLQKLIDSGYLSKNVDNYDYSFK